MRFQLALVALLASATSSAATVNLFLDTGMTRGSEVATLQMTLSGPSVAPFGDASYVLENIESIGVTGNIDGTQIDFSVISATGTLDKHSSQDVYKSNFSGLNISMTETVTSSTGAETTWLFRSGFDLDYNPFLFLNPGDGNNYNWSGSPQPGWGNVVPIPAAVWLFGSALTGLGWIRRKQAT